MGLNNKVNISEALLLFVMLISISCTTPAVVNSPAAAEKKVVVSPGYMPYDTAKVILYLDTTVLGPFNWPVKGKVISHYGRRGQRMHTGTDIKIAHGDTVKAAFTGVVTKSENYYGYGILVILKHPQNMETYYAHLSKALVKNGETVQKGMPVGLGGRTGRATTDHLHFEIRKNGKPLNPEHFFNFNDLNINTLVLFKATENKASAIEKAGTINRGGEYQTDAETGRKYHTVKKGDTLYSLSRRYGTTVDQLCRLNGIKKSDILKTGVKLRVK